MSGSPRSADRHSGIELMEELLELRHAGTSVEQIAERYGTTPGYVVALTDLFEVSLERSAP
ncbi:helix-turn-helix domain-containing protein [Nakamurella sp.]|uniref:helix-turn-helix domain-containing protein n=1 Tax=Nakamurella sp. TaxID=1869182 RepID=UPI003B3B4A14